MIADAFEMQSHPHWFRASSRLLSQVHDALAAIAQIAKADDVPHWASALLEDERLLREFVVNAIEGAVSVAASKARVQGQERRSIVKIDGLGQDFRSLLLEYLPLFESESDRWEPVLASDLVLSLRSGTRIGVGDGYILGHSGIVEMRILPKELEPSRLQESVIDR